MEVKDRDFLIFQVLTFVYDKFKVSSLFQKVKGKQKDIE